MDPETEILKTPEGITEGAPTELKEPEPPTDVEAFDAGLKTLEPEPPEEPKAKPDEKPEEKPGEKDKDKPAEKTEEKPTEEPEEKPGDNPEEDTEKTDEEIEKDVKDFGLKERAANRFRSLNKRPTQERFEEVQSRAQEADTWEQTVQATGASPEEFKGVMGMVMAFHSKDPEVRRKLYDTLSENTEALRKELGIAGAGQSPFSEFSDLKGEVDELTLTEERANEIAAARRQSQLQGDYQKSQQEEQAQQTAVEEAQAKGELEVNELDRYLQEHDADYSEKVKQMMPHMEYIHDHLPPEEWMNATARIWQTLTVVPASVNPVRPGATETMKVAPKNDVEAWDMGIASVK